MCRGNNHNGRRCPSDTSEARTLRRRNATARAEYSEQVAKPVEPKFRPAAEPETAFTVESIRADAESLKTLALKMKEAGEPSESILLAHDKILNNMGAGIDYLATEKYGAPTDEDLQNAEKEVTQRLLREAERRKRALAILAEPLKEERDTFAKELHKIADSTSHILNTDRETAWKKGNPELYAKWRAKQDEVNANHQEAYEAEWNLNNNIIDSQRALLEKRNEAIQAALREVGVNFADPETLSCSEKSHPSAVKSLKEALKFFPQEWIDKSNANNSITPLEVKNSSGRAHYQTKAERTESISFTKAQIYEKPEDWVPDPHDRSESEFTDLNGKDEWVDPLSGKTLTEGNTYTRKEGEEIKPLRKWVKFEYDYKQQETPPRGKGWEKVELKSRDYVDGKMGEEYLVTHYRKKKAGKKKGSETVSFAELTVNRDATVYVGTDNGMRIAMHEFSHRMEDTVRPISGYEDAFLRRRAGIISEDSNTIPEKLSSIYTPDGAVQGQKELGYKDNFPDHYMGKVYVNAHYREILSMGMESLFCGSNGALSGLRNAKPDPDYKRFILGVLASSAAKK